MSGALSTKAQTQPVNTDGSQISLQRTTEQSVQNYKLSPEKLEKAIAYSRIRNIFHFAGVGYSLLLLIIILSFKIGPKFRNIAERVSKYKVVQVFVFAPLILPTIDVLTLPLDAYRRTFALEYDQTIQTWGSWFRDWGIGEILTIGVSTAAIGILYLLIYFIPRRWWFYFWLLTLPFMLAAVFVIPVIVDPLFNKFVPLDRTEPALVSDIEKVTEHAGLQIPRDHVFEMAASEKTQTINAYVTGIGSTKRIVMWDTTVKQMTPPQVLFVVGHEMGHYVLGHIQKGLVFVAIVSLLLSFIGYHIILWVLRRWGNGWQIRDINDWASLPAMLLIVLILGFLTEPVFNTFSRYTEHQADVYGLEVTHGITPNANQVAAQSFQILGESYLEEPNPNPLIKVWLFSHPPINERLSFAAQYDPWSKGESPQFVK
jgi:Zn-dependent protease with chaperone function